MLEITNLLISIITLTILELVLSMDNIVAIGIITQELQGKKKIITRQVGVITAIGGRILLLLCINWLIHLNKPLFFINSFSISIKSIILLLGGLYIIYFAIIKIIQELKVKNIKALNKHNIKPQYSFLKAIISILIFDTVCSLDSVLTAVAIGYNLTIMIIAIIIACLLLLFSVNFINNFIESHPNLKMLALSFFILIGLSLCANAFYYKIPVFYMLIIMVFAALVQWLTISLAKKNHL